MGPSVFDGDWFKSKEPFESELTKLKHDKFGLRQKERKPIKKLKLRRHKERQRKYGYPVTPAPSYHTPAPPLPVSPSGPAVIPPVRGGIRNPKDAFSNHFSFSLGK